MMQSKVGICGCAECGLLQTWKWGTHTEKRKKEAGKEIKKRKITLESDEQKSTPQNMGYGFK